eukprot:TRINITY_DN3385_c0_g2_i1.p1 TRINITY_DN3385_c0_g2~~TRINITY_DN3385_c0_g2_i1.p1  ORF type:complete len:337 (+),score=89.09 TRINITY_DN3385_c0_g2_i1:62-1012(+)
MSSDTTQSLSKEQKRAYNSHVLEAKEIESQNPAKALSLYLLAEKILPSEKLAKKIENLKKKVPAVEKKLTLQQLDDGFLHCKEDGTVKLEGGFSFPETIYKQLFPYQREGVKWMWSLFKSRHGGILGDDMGLGKTVQVSSFLAALLEGGQIKRALILAPVSVLSHWQKTLASWSSCRIKLFHGTSKTQREKELGEVIKKGGCAISTYGMVLSSADKLSQIVWDYIILDEGHKIKNPGIKLSKILPTIESKHKVILTGTPIQNNLGEMWALFNYVCDGELLGSRKTFSQQFEEKSSKEMIVKPAKERKRLDCYWLNL